MMAIREATGDLRHLDREAMALQEVLQEAPQAVVPLQDTAALHLLVMEVLDRRDTEVLRLPAMEGHLQERMGIRSSMVMVARRRRSKRKTIIWPTV